MQSEAATEVGTNPVPSVPDPPGEGKLIVDHLGNLFEEVLGRGQQAVRTK